MAQYEPTRIPFAVAVGTDPDDNNGLIPLTWGFETRSGETGPQISFFWARFGHEPAWGCASRQAGPPPAPGRRFTTLLAQAATEADAECPPARLLVRGVRLTPHDLA
ncbi:hypothetical protein GCM10010339_55800 [Streptomyces alanosinicus]|uniref:Uncharacterized protein n=1 Tax=Streptomyces alanosinicus TaxID=68171 RepID=A0A919D550_9ACTN|nr:hypothetical protein GCM10010339_55800 [Streptomyces alanosinicus]